MFIQHGRQLTSRSDYDSSHPLPTPIRVGAELGREGTKLVLMYTPLRIRLTEIFYEYMRVCFPLKYVAEDERVGDERREMSGG
jgi:hypothetical protein